MIVPRLRRSCLSMPGSSTRMLAKAPSLPADEVFLDLEDSVALPENNDTTRQNVVEALLAERWLPRTRVVRINGSRRGGGCAISSKKL